MAKKKSILQTALQAQAKGKNPIEAVVKKASRNAKRRKGLKGFLARNLSK